jgi:hypothetical protein
MLLQQNIEQILATIKAIQIQHEHGYHISDSDFNQFNSAVNDVNALYHEIVKNRSK